MAEVVASVARRNAENASDDPSRWYGRRNNEEQTQALRGIVAG